MQFQWDDANLRAKVDEILSMHPEEESFLSGTVEIIEKSPESYREPLALTALGQLWRKQHIDLNALVRYLSKQNGNVVLKRALHEIGSALIEPLLAAGFRLGEGEAVPCAHLIACQPELIPILIEYGVNLDRVDQNGQHVLLRAYDLRKVESIRALLEGGVQYPGSVHHLLESVDRDDPKDCDQVSAILKIMADCGADLDEVVDGTTPLIKAIRDKQSRILRPLLELSVDVNWQDENGWAAIHHECDVGPLWENLELLIQFGADPSQAANDGRTPLMIHGAWNAGIPETFTPTINLRDHFGNTVLHHSVEVDHPKSVEHLIEQGIDVLAENDAGETALDVAVKNLSHRCVDKLLHHLTMDGS